MFIVLGLIFIAMFVVETMITAGIFMNQKELNRHMTPFIKWYCIIGMAIISVINLLGLGRLYHSYELGMLTVDNYIHAIYSLSVGMLFIGVLIYHYKYLRLGKKLVKDMSNKMSKPKEK